MALQGLESQKALAEAEPAALAAAATDIVILPPSAATVRSRAIEELRSAITTDQIDCAAATTIIREMIDHIDASPGDRGE